AGAERGQEGDPVLGAVHAPDDDAIALPKPGVLEVARHTRDDVVQIAIGPGARAKARPDRECVLRAELPGGLLQDVVERLHLPPNFAIAGMVSRPPSGYGAYGENRWFSRSIPPTGRWVRGAGPSPRWKNPSGVSTFP